MTTSPCPTCGNMGDLDPDGFYCYACNDYWDKRDYNERMDEFE